MRYIIKLDAKAFRELDSIPPKTADRILMSIKNLADNPRPPRCIKLKGRMNQYRIRIGNFRVLYMVDDGHSLVTVVHIKNRKDSYR